MRICLGLVTHGISGNSEGLRATGVQAQELKALWEVPCDAQGHMAGASGIEAFEMAPPLAMVSLVEGVEGHLEARQALQRRLVIQDLTGVVKPEGSEGC